MIGSSDGKQYEDDLSFALDVPINNAPRPSESHPMARPGMKENETRDSSKNPRAEEGLGGWIDPNSFMEKQGINTRRGDMNQPHIIDDNVRYPGTWSEQQRQFRPETIQRETSFIDRNHHVPLVASALTDDKGQMYGMAIDHRVPAKPEYEKHLWNHEAYENDYMNDLVKNGMTSQDAYHKAHDWSTARESAAVTAEFGEKGLEDYKQHWRDAASIASEPTDRGRHPDAHTTRHGLDESELGKSFKVAANDDTKHIKNPFERLETSHGIEHPQSQPLTPLKSGNALLKLPTGSNESIYSAAIKHQDQSIHMGGDHGEAYRNAYKETHIRPVYTEGGQGFVTSKGRFVDRHEAEKIAEKAGQVPLRHTLDSLSAATRERFGLSSEELDLEYYEDLRKFMKEAKEKYHNK